MQAVRLPPAERVRAGPRALRGALVLAYFAGSGMKLQRARDEAATRSGGSLKGAAGSGRASYQLWVRFSP